MSKERRERPIAVALHYDRRSAPRVTAKGAGAVAERILQAAREHGIPLQENAPLATLLARLELGQEIPRELYLAVAQVIAFAYLLRDMAADAPEPPSHGPTHGPD